MQKRTKLCLCLCVQIINKLLKINEEKVSNPVEKQGKDLNRTAKKKYT